MMASGTTKRTRCSLVSTWSNAELLASKSKFYSFHRYHFWIQSHWIYCNARYFIDEPEPEFTPPADVTLGRSQDNPGVDCRDLLENGPGSESGNFYVQPSPNAQVIEVYCDQETDGGGWTLMTQYMKRANEIAKNDDRIPTKYFES